jgi:23S rRNA (cytidine1920-2'-O)/16S rRNA (cytidine1409-2'-O)-methyltransferase
MKARTRLDDALVERGVCDDRHEAQARVIAGEVLVDDRPCDKPGTAISKKAILRLRNGARKGRFVSRGGDKLDGALEALAIDVRGRRALDLGASTGGFVDALLQRGAVEVIAVDVGYGLLAERLRNDPRVHVHERTNARTLDARTLPYIADLVVVDASFISVRALLDAVGRCATDDAWLVAMVKPQFELPVKEVPRGGVVRDDSERFRAAALVVAEAALAGWHLLGQRDSDVHGPAGNIEIFLWLGRGDARSAEVQS